MIFSKNGAAMTPTSTKKGTMPYRYYVSMDFVRLGVALARKSGCPLTPVAAGSFRMRHAPPEARRIKDRARAEAIAKAAAGFEGPITLKSAGGKPKEYGEF
jgi:hypothetical protein